MIFEGVVAFVQRLSLWEWFLFFWPFFFFDFVRYVLLDFILLPRFLIRRRKERALRARLRTRLFRERPLVSVIAPGKNEGRHIPALAMSLRRQTYQHFETIIVDDGSDDDTPAICRRLEQVGLIDLFIRNEVRGGKASAANTALRYARGVYILHLDADSHLADDAIETALLPFLQDPQVGAVGGDVRVANTDEAVVTSLQTIEYMKSISMGRTVSSMLGLLRIVAGAHGMFRRDLLERLGGWDVGPGLDGDLTVKIRKLGMKVVHEPEAVCYTNVPNTFLKLARQRFRWDRSLVRFRMRKHKDIFLPDANFQWRNFIASAENVFFNILLNIRWWIYIAQILIFNAEYIEYIVLINYLLYLSANILEFSMGCVLYGRTLKARELVLAPYLLLMPPYVGIYLRLVRSYAYLMESLHRISYLDRWNPWKVSSVNRREDA